MVCFVNDSFVNDSICPPVVAMTISQKNLDVKLNFPRKGKLS